MIFSFTKAKNLDLCLEKGYFLNTKVVSIGFSFKKRCILTITTSNFEDVPFI